MPFSPEVRLYIFIGLIALWAVLLLVTAVLKYFVLKRGVENQINIAKDVLKSLNVMNQQLNQHSKLLEMMTKNQVNIADSVFESIQALRRQLFTGQDTSDSAVLISGKRSSLRS